MSRLILLVTTDKHLEKHIKQLGDIYAVQTLIKGIQIAKAETFDLIAIGPPFSLENKDQVLEIQHEHLYLLKTPEDLKKMLDDYNPKQKAEQKEEDKKSLPKQSAEEQPSLSATPEMAEIKSKELYDYKILLVSTKEETISALKQFDLIIATSSYSAQHNKLYQAVVWDLPGDHPKFNVPVYVWNKDVNTSDELFGYIKSGPMYIKQNKPVIKQKTELQELSKPVNPSKLVEALAEKPQITCKNPKSKVPPIDLDKGKNEVEILDESNVQHQDTARPQRISSICLPVVIGKMKKEPKKKAFNLHFLQGLFAKTGYVRQGKFYKHKANSINELLLLEPTCDAIVFPASWGINEIKLFRRNIHSKTVLLVVINGSSEHLSCGADYCVKKVTKQMASEITHVSQKTKTLWKTVDTDALTGLYSRGFMNQWLDDQTPRKTPFSMVIMDIDHFKNVNDTYGHPAGDAVLSALGDFINQSIRSADIAFRYGGEEFVIALPYTDANQTYALIDRMRRNWAERVIQLPDGQGLQTTFSAGVAEWYEGCDVKMIADSMLYKAKESGRNQVQANNLRNRALILGKFSTDLLKENGIDITYDPEQASIIVADKNGMAYAPTGLSLYVLGTGDMSDWLIKRERPDAVICKSLDDVIDKVVAKPKLQVLPGVRTHENSQTITKHGAIYVVCPSRPAASGEIAVNLCHGIRNVALVCASSESTGALTIGIPEKTLITADWRIPNANAPLEWTGVTVWPVDPYKHLQTNYDVHKLVDEIKYHFSMVVVDCGGNLDLCSRIAGDEGVLLIYREGDASDVATGYWLKNHNNQNVLSMSPSEEPEIVEAENGYLIAHKSVNRSMKHRQ